MKGWSEGEMWSVGVGIGMGKIEGSGGELCI